jgi:hypothetical protein
MRLEFLSDQILRGRKAEFGMSIANTLLPMAPRATLAEMCGSTPGRDGLRVGRNRPIAKEDREFLRDD